MLGYNAPEGIDLTSKGDKITPVDLSKVPLETLLELAKHVGDTENKK
jgi:hypothetical protein